MSSSPNRTTAKADVMNDMATSKTIDADVNSAASNFEELQKNLDSLLSSLREHHKAIVALNEKRLEAASNFEVFVANSPIHKVAGVFNLEEAKAAIFKVDLAKYGVKDVESSSEAAQTHETEEDPPSEHSEGKDSTKEEPPKAAVCDDEEEKEEETSAVEEAAPSVPSSGTSVVSEAAFKIASPLKTAPPEFFDIESSFAAVRQTSYKLNKMYANQYKEHIIEYVEAWQKITKERVKSRLMEFNNHEKHLSHYRDKVEKLLDAADKLEARQKSMSTRQADKLERNKLKLNGVREAHDAYGESLSLLIEEINQQAWRDVLPVLLRTLEFDHSFSRDEAKVYAKSDKPIAALKSIAEEYNVSPSGRLQDLKAKKPEALYTGEREVMAPVVKSPHHAQ